MESTATSLTESLLPASQRKSSFARAAAALIGAILLFTACVALALVLVVPGLTTVGLLAYAFGCRHGVDADHIAAIDNVTRRLVASGRRATTVGVFFSLGHCTVVLVLCAAVVASAGAIQSLNLGLYDNLRRQLAPGRAREDTPLARVALAAAGAGACVALVTCPQQRVKIVQQLRGGRLAPTAAALWRERTLYRGLGAQVLFESSRSIYMATYEGLKRAYVAM